MPTDGCYCGEYYFVGASGAEIALFDYGFTASLGADELCEHVFFPGIPRDEFRPDFGAQFVARKRCLVVGRYGGSEVDVAAGS